MSASMLAWTAAGCYAVAWLGTARLLFGWWRSRGVSAKTGRWCPEHGYRKSFNGYEYDRRGCCLNEQTGSDAQLAASAMLAALAFPVVILAAIVRMKPPPTAAERAAQVKAQAEELQRVRDRNAELERELGMTGDQP